MSAEDIITSIVLGFVAGLLIFAGIVAARRGKPWWPVHPVRLAVAPDDDRRQTSSAPLTIIEPSGFRPLVALLRLDRLYVLCARVVLVSMVLYGAWVAPRLRWVLLGAVTTLALLLLMWHFAVRWLHGRSRA